MNWKPACPSCTSTWASDRCGEMEKQSDGGNQMMELLGVPPQVLFGQLLLGLINGSFYALLSLGLAVIFGMLNVINFAHGAQYMLGAFAAWMLLKFTGIGYWWALILAPLVVGPDRRRAGKADAEPALQARPPLRPAADLRAGPDHRGHVPPLVRRLRPALPDPEGAGRRLQPRLHVPADIPRLGRHRLGRGLLRHLVRDRAHQARAPTCAPPPRTRCWCRPSASTCRS